jgi:hypothetical protein
VTEKVGVRALLKILVLLTPRGLWSDSIEGKGCSDDALEERTLFVPRSEVGLSLPLSVGVAARDEVLAEFEASGRESGARKLKA